MKTSLYLFLLISCIGCGKNVGDAGKWGGTQGQLKNLFGAESSPVDPEIGYVLIKARRDSLLRLMNGKTPPTPSGAAFDTSDVELYTYFPFKMFRDSIQKLIDLDPTDTLTADSDFGIRFYPILYDSTNSRVDAYLNNHKYYRGRQSMLAAVTLDSLIIPPGRFNINTIYNLGGLVPPGKPPLKENYKNLLPDKSATK